MVNFEKNPEFLNSNKLYKNKGGLLYSQKGTSFLV